MALKIFSLTEKSLKKEDGDGNSCVQGAKKHESLIICSTHVTSHASGKY